MLLVDDLLTAPVKGLLWIFEEIHKAADADQRARRDEIMAELSALYIALEQGKLTDEAFEAREQSLLDELDELDARYNAEDAADEDEDEDEQADETSTDDANVSGGRVQDQQVTGHSS